jgi:hypothetical protein
VAVAVLTLEHLVQQSALVVLVVVAPVLVELSAT